MMKQQTPYKIGTIIILLLFLFSFANFAFNIDSLILATWTYLHTDSRLRQRVCAVVNCFLRMNLYCNKSFDMHIFVPFCRCANVYIAAMNFSSTLCPGQCNNQGACENGTCTCESGKLISFFEWYYLVSRSHLFYMNKWLVFFLILSLYTANLSYLDLK